MVHTPYEFGGHVYDAGATQTAVILLNTVDPGHL